MSKLPVSGAQSARDPAFLNSAVSSSTISPLMELWNSEFFKKEMQYAAKMDALPAVQVRIQKVKLVCFALRFFAPNDRGRLRHKQTVKVNQPQQQ